MGGEAAGSAFHGTSSLTADQREHLAVGLPAGATGSGYSQNDHTAHATAGMFIMRHLSEKALFQGKFLLIWISTTELAALADGMDLGLHSR